MSITWQYPLAEGLNCSYSRLWCIQDISQREYRLQHVFISGGRDTAPDIPLAVGPSSAGSNEQAK